MVTAAVVRAAATGRGSCGNGGGSGDDGANSGDDCGGGNCNDGGSNGGRSGDESKGRGGVVAVVIDAMIILSGSNDSDNGDGDGSSSGDNDIGDDTNQLSTPRHHLRRRGKRGRWEKGWEGEARQGGGKVRGRGRQREFSLLRDLFLLAVFFPPHS